MVMQAMELPEVTATPPASAAPWAHHLVPGESPFALVLTERYLTLWARPELLAVGVRSPFFLRYMSPTRKAAWPEHLRVRMA